MKILLIFPPVTIYGSDPTFPGANPPFGLAYIAAYLVKNGYEVKILDALALGIDQIVRGEGKMHVGLTEEQIENYISEYQPQIVGISSMFTAYAMDAHAVARLAKKINPEILVVFGGAHACINPEMVLKDKYVNMIVMGEGEVTFLEIVKSLEMGDGLTDIMGTVVKVDGKIIRNKPRPFIENLDTLPFPARHLLPTDIYFKKNESPYIMRRPMAQMVTSRGCPQNCIFCSIHAVWHHHWKGRSAKNVVDEIELLMKEYGIREISFLDDSMATSKDRMHQICDEIIFRKLDIKWTTPNGITHWSLDEELLDKMKRSGCYRLTFGIESGNPGTRKFIRKYHSLEQATKIIKYANKIGMWTICTFIIGFPYEDIQSINDTIKYAVDSDTDYALFYLVLPFPGTDLYDIYKKEGLLDLDSIFFADNPCDSDLDKIGATLAHGGCDTKFFTREKLREILSSAYKSFWNRRFKDFFNPMRVLCKIRSREDLRYAWKILFVGINLGMKQIGRRRFLPQMVYKNYEKIRGELTEDRINSKEERYNG